MPAPIRDLGHIPGPIFIPDCVAVRLYWKIPNGKTIFNVLHASYDTIPGLSEEFVETLQTAVEGALNTSGWLTSLDTETVLAKVGIRDMREVSAGTGLSEWVSSGGGVPGTAVGGGPMPPQIAFVVSLKTGLAGQANRGRIYLPGINTGTQDPNGLMKGPNADSAVTFIRNVRTAMTAQNLTMCIAHPARQAYTGRDGADHAARDAGTVPVSNIVSLDNVYDTQRLRARV